jgi:hypothetical protein
MDLHIRLPKTLGCTIASTAVLQSLKGMYPFSKITAYTDTPDLIMNLECIDKKQSAADFIQNKTNIDWYNYLEEHTVLGEPSGRHLIDYMYEIAENSIGSTLTRSYHPKVNLTEEEELIAQDIVEKVSNKKPLVWLQKKTSTNKKDWRKEYWDELVQSNEDLYSFLELDERFPKRTAIAITKFCRGGITLDTFLSHGSQAVGAPNVIVILVSTRPETVTYSNQIVLYNPNEVVTPALVTEKVRQISF